MPTESQSLRKLLNVFPHPGRVDWIGLRPGRRAPIAAVQTVVAEAGEGLRGDHYAGKGGKRQVTLIQAEHLSVVASILGVDAVRPEQLRRNVVVYGLNLLALKGQSFSLGEVVLEYTGLCHPCSFMESALGRGGYNAMRGHGGITARVITGGELTVGSPVTVLSDGAPHAT
jgi:MOSC domain-containing protein YiiM